MTMTMKLSEAIRGGSKETQPSTLFFLQHTTDEHDNDVW